MCFSAAANFVGSGVLGAVGVLTLTKVKHRRELLFAALPTLFAIHQFIEGFVWLGLDGILSPTVTHDMGAAFMLYAQGLLPFLLPLSVLLFEPDAQSRRRRHAVAVPRARRTWNGALYTVGVDWHIRCSCMRPGKQHRVHQSSDEQYSGCGAVCDRNLRFAVFFQGQGNGNLRRSKPCDSPDCDGVQEVRVHLAMVCIRGDRECDHPCLLLGEPQNPAPPLRRGSLFVQANSQLLEVRLCVVRISPAASYAPFCLLRWPEASSIRAVPDGFLMKPRKLSHPCDLRKPSQNVGTGLDSTIRQTPMAKTDGRIITVGVTGASGAIYAQSLLRLLDADRRVERVYLVASLMRG